VHNFKILNMSVYAYLFYFTNVVICAKDEISWMARRDTYR